MSPFYLISGGSVRAREKLTRTLNWLGTVLDSPDYSYRAAMPRARAPFPHPSVDPVHTPSCLLSSSSVLLRTHTREQRVTRLGASACKNCNLEKLRFAWQIARKILQKSVCGFSNGNWSCLDIFFYRFEKNQFIVNK